MRAVDNDALICDFAQYYHIREYMDLGIQKAAILACGLPTESRIMMRLSGQKFPLETILQIMIADTLRMIEYAYCQAHSKKTLQKPKSILQIIGQEEGKEQIRTFNSPEEFEEAKRKIINGE